MVVWAITQCDGAYIATSFLTLDYLYSTKFLFKIYLSIVVCLYLSIYLSILGFFFSWKVKIYLCPISKNHDSRQLLHSLSKSGNSFPAAWSAFTSGNAVRFGQFHTCYLGGSLPGGCSYIKSTLFLILLLRVDIVKSPHSLSLSLSLSLYLSLSIYLFQSTHIYQRCYLSKKRLSNWDRIQFSFNFQKCQKKAWTYHSLRFFFFDLISTKFAILSMRWNLFHLTHPDKKKKKKIRRLIFKMGIYLFNPPP